MHAYSAVRRFGVAASLPQRCQNNRKEQKIDGDATPSPLDPARTMSQKTVQWLIGRLVTDEEIRLRFLEDPRGSLNALREEGFALTNTEIDALVQTDPVIWSQAAARIDLRLQRSSLRSD